MKCSESWLREWVNPKITREKLCSDLTMAGLEVEELAPIKGSELAQLVSKNELNDYTIDISITPNRGDCLSVRGIAREISALTKSSLKEPSISPVKPIIKDALPIHIQAKAGCPHYIGRIIRNVRANLTTPDWLKNRLVCSGVKIINPIVDVTNYVMLELGQPMHAFDFNTVDKEINVRLAKKGEQITLLDGSVKELDSETLIIADHKNPLAIAGVMGGLDSSVTLTTQDILLESAFFSPNVIARQRQYYGLNSDSAYRFERGVDPAIQRQAIERATQLIIEIVGGSAGPIIEVISKSHLPKETTISLAADKLQQVLGVNVSKKDVDAIFASLNFTFKSTKNKWVVRVPSYRFDITLAEDLIEEIARLYGYDRIPTHHIRGELGINKTSEAAPDLHQLRQALCDQGYHEIISYSFVDKKLQTLLNPDESPRELLNPITADMDVMRTNLWPGLVNSLLYNKSRQQNRVRLFEIGTSFVTSHKKLEQSSKIAGLITGLCFPEQWGMPSRKSDFYDLKGNVENILSMSYPSEDYVFKPDAHPALHPGQSAGIYHHNKKIGILGALHPGVLQTLGESDQIFVFELDLNSLKVGVPTRFHEISKFPEIRRDIAILVNQTVRSKDIQDTIKDVAGSWLKDVFIFDVYQGKGISPGLKSIALGLILQHPTRTLVDDEVTELMNRVIATLKGQLGAELRS